MVNFEHPLLCYQDNVKDDLECLNIYHKSSKDLVLNRMLHMDEGFECTKLSL